ncbi:MAG TPA: response regulator transcription factor, partial [Catalimonadaceae bacterium]|nr:response regulator transcription factor [Catalimonadaceae bacterium]
MIRILLFDDNHKIRESLEFLFGNTDGFQIVGSFSHCHEVEKRVKDLQPNVVLMDIDMPEISGIEAVKRIRKTNSEVPVMMLTIFDDDQKIVDALAAGANGYLLKNKSLDRLVDSVRELKDGGAPLTPSIAKKVLE